MAKEEKTTLNKLEAKIDGLVESQESFTTTLEDLARITQKGFQDVDKRFQDVDKRFQDLDRQFEKVHERLNTLEDRISYSSQSFSLLMRDLEQTKTRVTRLEEKTGILDE